MVNALDLFLIVCLISLLVISAVRDIQFKKIANLVAYPSMVAALLYHLLTEGFGGLLFSAGGLALVIALSDSVFLYKWLQAQTKSKEVVKVESEAVPIAVSSGFGTGNQRYLTLSREKSEARHLTLF